MNILGRTLFADFHQLKQKKILKMKMRPIGRFSEKQNIIFWVIAEDKWILFSFKDKN